MPDLTKDAVLARCPCPFCKATNPGRLRQNSRWEIVCRQCGACGPLADTEAAAIAAWNRRAIVPLLDVTGEEEEQAQALIAAVSGALRHLAPPIRDEITTKILAAILPLITARIAQAEQAATERAALIADQRKAYWHDQWASKRNGWHVMLSSHEDEAGYIAAAIRSRNTEEAR